MTKRTRTQGHGQENRPFGQRRADDTRRWRERLQRGAAVYPVEVDGQLFDLMERFGELKDTKTGDRQGPVAKFFVKCHSSGI